MRVFYFFLLSTTFALLIFSSCRKDWHVQDQYLGEYQGVLTVEEDSVVIVGLQSCTVVLEKAGKALYRIYSPTHPNDFPDVVYEVSKEVTKGISNGGEGQGGFRTDDRDWIFSLFVDESSNVIALTIERDNQPSGNTFLYLGEKSL